MNILNKLKKIPNKILPFLRSRTKKQIIWSLAGLLVVGGIARAVFGGGLVPTIVLAERGTIEEEVLVSGKTKSSAEVDLGFEKGGRVVVSNLLVGSRVVEGQTLSVLDESTTLADLRKAQANLDEELVGLSTTEKESGVSYQGAYNTLNESVRDAYAKSDDAIRNNVDRFFTNPRDYNAFFDPSFTDGSATYYFNVTDTVKRDLGNDRKDVETVLTTWINNLNPKNETDLLTKETLAENNLRLVRDFIDKVAYQINSIKSVDYSHDTTVQGYKTTVSTARAEVTTALSNLISSRDKFNSAPKAISTEGQVSYDEVLQGEARVESLRANVDSIRADLSKMVIVSPIQGVVTKMDAKRGEIVTAGTPLISIISDTKLQIEANVSEVNIDKVRVGNSVSITFDANPGEIYTGKVSYIDPAATVVDNVPTYKVTVSIDATSKEIRSGLTANLKIQTAKKDDVVKIPAYAVFREGDSSFVTIKVSDKDTEKRAVVTGLRGKDGTLEVVSGLKGTEELMVTK